MTRKEFKIAFLVSKAKKTKYEESSMRIVIRIEETGKIEEIKISKNFFFNQIYYNGINISVSKLDGLEIVKFKKEKWGWEKVKELELYKIDDQALKEIEEILFERLSFFQKLIYKHIDKIIDFQLFLVAFKEIRKNQYPILSGITLTLLKNKFKNLKAYYE